MSADFCCVWFNGRGKPKRVHQRRRDDAPDQSKKSFHGGESNPGFDGDNVVY